MAGGLAGLTKLKTLSIIFRIRHDDPPYSDKQLEEGGLDPPMRADLPALSKFSFRGKSEYLENLVAQIDTPQVEDVAIMYVMPEVQVDARQLSQFIGRTANLEFTQFRRAQITFNFYGDCQFVSIDLDRPQGECHQVRFSLTMDILNPELDCLVKCIAGVLGQLGVMLSNVDHLAIKGEDREYRAGKDDGIDSTEWPPLLRLFPAAKALHVSGRFAAHFASALEDIAEERVTKVLPALHLLWIADGDKPVESTERFLSLRRLSGHPVAVVNTKDKFVG